jgi:hypothetical protein
MANNLIQIKRSAGNSIPASLNPGELAYSNVVEVLYIGSTDGATIVPIAGQRTPGTATANQALVVNSTFGISGIAILTVNDSSTTQTSNTTYHVITGNTNPMGMLVGNSTANVLVQLILANTGGTTTLNAASISTTNIYGTLQTASQPNIVANSANYIGSVPASNVVTTVASQTLTGNNTLAGTNTVISSNLAVSGATIQGVNMTLSGNLTVAGTVELVNTTELIVNANFIELGSNLSALTSDTIDTGWWSPANSSGPSTPYYNIFGRIASKSTNVAPFFWLGVSNTSPNTHSTFDIASANAAVGFLQSYLVPYGAGGAFVVNSTGVTVTANSTLPVSITANTLTTGALTLAALTIGGLVVNSTVVNITANSTVSSTIVANSLTLTTALLATYGGTGVAGGSYAAGDILYAATAAPSALSRLGVGSNGYVLQITNNLPAYGTLDGGSF